MKYVTIPMMCAHAGKAPGTVLRALKAHATPTSEEREVRDALYKAFDSEAKHMASPSEHSGS
jgi:hypothetical protein